MNEPAPRMELRVRKRDGSLESFSLAKVAQCIQAGLLAANDDENARHCARNLAEAVQDFLVSDADGPHATTRILELVEVVLTQTGHPNAAVQAIRFAESRQACRRRLIIASYHPRDGRLVHRRWDKPRLIAYLRREHGLDMQTARMIAGRVELQLFNCQMKTVTASLIYGMTASELLAWGLVPEALTVKRTRDARKSARVRDRADPA